MSSTSVCSDCGKPVSEPGTSFCSDCAERHKKSTSVLTAEEEIARAKSVLFDDVQVSTTPTPKPTSKLGPGLSQRYELVRPLETTLFSEVFLVSDRELSRQVVIKYLNLSTRFEHVERFKREAQLLANFKHANIVRVYDSGVDDGRMYIVMEFIEGLALDTFNARLVQMNNEERRIRRVCEIIQEVCYALEYLHAQGIVHRDIKPSNILLDRLGKPYLIDFGIARRVSGKELITVEGELIGTVAYMSPEQAGGNANDIDRRTDIYSVGVMLYHLLTGQLPFGGANYDEVLDQIRTVTPVMPSHLNNTVTPELERVLLKTLAKEKDQRYQTATDLARELEAVIKPKPAPAAPRRVRVYGKYKVHIAVALNVIAFAIIGWTLFGPGDDSGTNPALYTPPDDVSLARLFLRGTFGRGDIGGYLSPVDGEIGVENGSLVIRNGAVQIAGNFKSASDLRIEVDLSFDHQSVPRETSIALCDTEGCFWKEIEKPSSSSQSWIPIPVESRSSRKGPN